MFGIFIDDGKGKFTWYGNEPTVEEALATAKEQREAWQADHVLIMPVCAVIHADGTVVLEGAKG